MKSDGISASKAKFFLPPYEWYNDSIATWTKELGLQLINFTPGTLSNADYTTPELRNYHDSKTIYQSVMNYEKQQRSGLNGFILLLHIGTDAKRSDKFYKLLPELVSELKLKGYKFERVNEMLK